MKKIEKSTARQHIHGRVFWENGSRSDGRDPTHETKLPSSPSPPFPENSSVQRNYLHKADSILLPNHRLPLAKFPLLSAAVLNTRLPPKQETPPSYLYPIKQNPNSLLLSSSKPFNFSSFSFHR
ncbi:hypothetical protein SLEP1_g55699 [Rubroshorea leprosula]|uniref:Uncharacterized protein n=1 Tax=Rubroshorea leprosula TaxID=152421 RepID=A0AAV5MHC5_9ROSI|nr:hypothetical protein SLEP1_g55699 [Rubroshorea leprosula]